MNNEIVLYLNSYRQTQKKIGWKKNVETGDYGPHSVNITNNVKINTLLPNDLFIHFLVFL